MKRKEEIIQASEEFGFFKAAEAMFTAGAEWADQHPRKGLVDIEKVCEWLDLHMPFGEVDKKLRDEVIDNLKKAMEE